MEYLELMKIRGISLRVHLSWFFIFFFFAWASQIEISNLLEVQVNPLMSWGLGFLFSLLVFCSVLLHELGHLFIALQEGVKIKSITLFLLGGVAVSKKECQKAMPSLRIAVAGPLVSFFLAFFFLGCVNLTSQSNLLASNIFIQLVRINSFLTIFNLLPALPLDGGLIVKSVVWHVTGSKRKGQKIANSIGKWLSLFAIFWGSLIFFQGAGFTGLWLMIIGWFGFSFSRSQNQLFTFQELLCELQVQDASQRGFRVLETDETLRTLSRLWSKSTKDDFFDDWVLLCKSGRWVGYITDEALKEVPVQFWDNYYLAGYSRPLSELPSISGREPLWRAVLKLEETGQNKLLVFNLAGLPSGTIEKVDIGEALLLKIGVKLPRKFLEVARKKSIYPLGMSLVDLVEGMVSSGLIKDSGENS